MPLAEFQLGEWLPDRPSFENPGCEVAENVIPTPGGYGPLLDLNPRTGELSAACKGARQLFTSGGQSIIVGGQDTRLFTLRSTLAETTGLSSLGAGEAWDFAQFNDFVIATAANNSPQYLTNVDSDDTWEDLTGSPPDAKRCAKVNEFLMLGSIDGAPNRVQWSSFNSPATSWTPDRLTQAGFADLPKELGEVQRIVGGRYATIFQKRGISRMSYVGPPKVWQIDPISVDRGAVAAFSVVPIGYLTYFLAQDGFYVTNGSSVEPIGSRRINSWFLENVDQTRIGEVHGAVDWQNKCIVWSFHSLASETFDTLLIYSWEENRWSSAKVSVDRLVSSAIGLIDIDSLDAIYGNLDSIPVSLDSSEFKDKDRVLAAFAPVSGTSTYQTFDGLPLEARWETGEFQPSPMRRVFVYEASPLIEAEDWDCKFTLRIRDNRYGEVVSTTSVTGWGGFAAIRGEGQRMAVRMVKPSGTWRDAQAIQIRFRQAGYR